MGILCTGLVWLLFLNPSDNVVGLLCKYVGPEQVGWAAVSTDIAADTEQWQLFITFFHYIYSYSVVQKAYIILLVQFPYEYVGKIKWGLAAVWNDTAADTWQQQQLSIGILGVRCMKKLKRFSVMNAFSYYSFWHWNAKAKALFDI